MRHNTGFADLLADLPRDNTVTFGSAFELVSDYALYASNDYGPHIARIERYEHWAARTGAAVLTDTGVDRVITTHSGALWAVQNKAMTNAADRVHFPDFNNFLVRGHALGAEKLLLVTSGAGITEHSAENNAAMGGRVVVLNRDWMEQVGEYPTTWQQLRLEMAALDPERFRARRRLALRDDQLEAVEAVTAALRTSPDVQYVAACGTGKTITSQAIAERLRANTVVFFVPNLSLMHGAIAAYFRQWSGGIHVAAVCSDMSVGRRPEADDIVMDESDLGVQVLRDPAQIAEFVTRHRENDPGRPVVLFSTYHSADLVIAAQHLHGAPEFDLCIADEAHRLVGTDDTGRRLGEGVKRKPGRRARLRARWRVYQTATPVGMTNALQKKADTVGSAPLDTMGPNSPVFGPEAYVLPFGKAIKLGILSAYDVVIIAVREQAHADLINERVYIDRDDSSGVLDAQTFAAIEAVKEIADRGANRIITYHSRKASARAFAARVDADDRLPGAAIVSGDQSAAQRNARLERLNGDGGYVISNVRCLNEGVDVPALDAVMFVDPKASEIDIAQSIGRVLRRSPGKDRGLVVIPIAMPDSYFENAPTVDDLAEEASVAGPFRTLIDVLIAMADQDDTIRQLLHDARFGLGRRRNQDGKQKQVEPGEDRHGSIDDFVDAVTDDDGDIDADQKAPFLPDTSSLFGSDRVTLYAPGMNDDARAAFADSITTRALQVRYQHSFTSEPDGLVAELVDTYGVDEATARAAVIELYRLVEVDRVDHAEAARTALAAISAQIRKAAA